MNLYLIRHGTTRENEANCFLGWTDPDLSPRGIRQAKRLSGYFRDLPPISLYCSDLKRTIQTAGLIGRRHGLKPKTSSLLRELNFGKWEGLTWKQINDIYPKKLKLWLEDPFQYAPPEGENLNRMIERTDKFLNTLPQINHLEGNILIVTHGGVIRLWLLRLLALSKTEFWNLSINTASVSLLKKSGDRFHPVYINKTVGKA